MDFSVRIRELERDRVNFVLKGTNLGYLASLNASPVLIGAIYSFANALRRTMMADLPTVGGYARDTRGNRVFTAPYQPSTSSSSNPIPESFRMSS